MASRRNNNRERERLRTENDRLEKALIAGYKECAIYENCLIYLNYCRLHLNCSIPDDGLTADQQSSFHPVIQQPSTHPHFPTNFTSNHQFPNTQPQQQQNTLPLSSATMEIVPPNSLCIYSTQIDVNNQPESSRTTPEVPCMCDNTAMYENQLKSHNTEIDDISLDLSMIQDWLKENPSGQLETNPSTQPESLMLIGLQYNAQTSVNSEASNQLSLSPSSSQNPYIGNPELDDFDLL